MLESSGKRRWRKLVTTVCAAGLLGGHWLQGPMLFGQQPGTLAPQAPTNKSWSLFPAALGGAKKAPLRRVAVEPAVTLEAAGRSAAAENPAAAEEAVAENPFSVKLAADKSAVDESAARDDSLPPIVSSANMPRPSRNKKPAGPAAASPVNPGAAVVEATAVQAIPVPKKPLVTAPPPADVPLPAGKPSSSSPWMQDIRTLIEAPPGPKTADKTAEKKTEKLAELLAEKMAAKAAAENGEKNATKQVQYEGNEPLPATAPPAEIIATPVLAIPGNDPSAPTPALEGQPTPAAPEFGPRLATVPQNTLPQNQLPQNQLPPNPLQPAQPPAPFGPPNVPGPAPAFPQAQPVNLLAQPPAAQPLQPTPQAPPIDLKEDAMRRGGSPFEVIDETGAVQVMVRRSKLLRTKVDIYRTAVVDDSICEIVQFTPREVSLIGKSQGSTHVTFWFDDPAMAPVTYVIQVVPDVATVKIQEDTYKMLQDVINEMFPDSKIQLLIVADKLIVRGQAKDSEEAAQIIALVRSQTGGNMPGAGGAGWGGGLSEGAAAQVLSDSATGAAQRSRLQVINMVRVPGVQQVALRVKIAEMNRSAARGFGIDVKGNINFTGNPDGSQLFLQSLLNTAAGAGPALLTQVDGDDIQIGVRYLQSHGVLRLLSEPTLVTMSGTPATFIAGGEFAVPTLVGSAGLNAVTTDFRAFGAIISFMPTVVDKDRIRLQVSPEFSQINSALTVNNTPGLRVRAATTTVEMREGQTLAIAGLLEDNMNGTNVGDIPFLAKVFGRRDMSRNETELLILVTPELVHAMEPEEVPPLPGFDVTEPTSAQFFLHGRLEGNPTQDYRSTVWPRLKKRYGAGGPAMTSGPFGHGQ
jgi:pilus assembly protein CpaC